MPAPSDKAVHAKLQDQTIAWLVCLRDDNVSDTELEAFADWLNADTLNAEAFTEAENLFRDMAAVGSLAKESESKPMPSRQSVPQIRQAAKIKPAKLQTIPRPHRSWLLSGLAVAALCLLTIGLIMPRQAALLGDYFCDYHTKTGELRDIQLSDGSRLLMNTNSALSVDFTAHARRIVLHHGQVRFSVAKDSGRPFEVLAGDLTVRALGTVFEVYKAMADRTEVSVQEHAVAVSTATDNMTVPVGQGLSYRSGQPLPHPQAMRAEQSAWQQHRLVINDRPLAELIAELERYRFGRIFLADAALKNLRVTGVFSLDAPDAALTAVRKALALQETRIGPWWVLLHR